MKRGQKGFGAVEGLLVLILLAILGFTGYYVYHTKNNTNSTYNNAAKAGTSTVSTSKSSDKTYNGDGFTLKYPSDWKFTAGDQQSPDDMFTPASSSNAAAPIIYIESGSTTYTKASDDWPVNGSGHAGNVTESKSLTIKSYSAYYVVSTFDSSKTYTYDIVRSGKAVNINLVNNTDSEWQTVLQQIANSIQFN